MLRNRRTSSCMKSSFCDFIVIPNMVCSFWSLVMGYRPRIRVSRVRSFVSTLASHSVDGCCAKGLVLWLLFVADKDWFISCLHICRCLYVQVWAPNEIFNSYFDKTAVKVVYNDADSHPQQSFSTQQRWGEVY